MEFSFAGGRRVALRVALGAAFIVLAACGGGDSSAPPAAATSGDAGGDASAVPPDASVTPKAIDLSHWRLTLPVDAGNGTSGAALDILPAALTGTPPYQSPWFYVDTDGALTFWVPADGAIGGSSPNPRSELREMLDPGNARVNWSASQNSHLLARCKIIKVPAAHPQVIVGQIHAYQSAHPLVMLQYSLDAATGIGRLVAHVNTTPDAAATLKFPLLDDLPPNRAFTYELAIDDGVLTMAADGHSAQYTLGSAWRSAGFYFKAGAYTKAGGSDGALVGFYRLDATHA
jgi:hypothetical protein